MPFLAPDELDRCGLDDTGIRLANPLVAEESVLRTSLLPGLVKAVAYNASAPPARGGPVRDRSRVRPPAERWPAA